MIHEWLSGTIWKMVKLMSTMINEIKHTPKLGWEIAFAVLFIIAVLISIS